MDAWGLNGVNKSSFYMKKINSEWDFSWWKPTETYYRTYWAEDDNYNTGSYPKDAKEHSEEELTHWALKYFSANAITSIYKENTPQYCLENTMEAGVVLDKFMISGTHVIVLATVKLASDKPAVDLFNYKGTLYDLDNYRKVTLSDLTASYNIYKKEGSTYTQIKENDIEVKSLMDGKVTIGLTEAAATYTWVSDSDGTDTPITDFESIFASLNEADGYKNGQMYYAIPIEHLARTSVESPYQTGDYGVVRNHFYNITINKIENLGKGIYDPEEIIVPNFDPEEYFVAAELHILSWKNVNQSVDL